MIIGQLVNGIVLDHITAGKGMEIYNVLGLGELMKDIFPADAWQQLLESVDGEVILNLAMNAVNAASNVVVIMACITLGAVVAKKHKLLVAVGFYYAASTVRNTVSTIVMASTMESAQTFEKVMTVSSVSNAVIGVLFAVGGYFLSVYLMDHKLNLP